MRAPEPCALKHVPQGPGEPSLLLDQRFLKGELEKRGWGFNSDNHVTSTDASDVLWATRAAADDPTGLGPALRTTESVTHAP